MSGYVGVLVAQSFLIFLVYSVRERICTFFFMHLKVGAYCFTPVRSTVRPFFCPSVRPSVRPSVCPSIRLFRPSHCGYTVIQLNSYYSLNPSTLLSVCTYIEGVHVVKVLIFINICSFGG